MDRLAFLAFRAAADSAEQVAPGSFPENTLRQIALWGEAEGWWNREWATAAEAAEALEISQDDVEALVTAKSLVSYGIDGALHIPSRDLAMTA